MKHLVLLALVSNPAWGFQGTEHDLTDSLGDAEAFLEQTNGYQGLPIAVGYVSGGPAEIQNDEYGRHIAIDLRQVRNHLYRTSRAMGAPLTFEYGVPPAQGTREFGVATGFLAGLLLHEAYHLGCCHDGANACQHAALFRASAAKTCTDLAGVNESITTLEMELQDLENNGGSSAEIEAKKAEIAEKKGLAEGMCAAIADAIKRMGKPEAKAAIGACASQPSNADDCVPASATNCPVPDLPPPQEPIEAPDWGYPDGVVEPCSNCPPGSGGNPSE